MKKMIIELLFALPLIAGGVACGSDEEPAAPIENKQYKVLPHTTSMEVRWKDAAGVVRFCVEYAEDASMDAVQSVEVEAPSTNVLIEGLSPETDYFVRTRAYNGVRWTEWTDITPIRTAQFTVSVETYNLLGADITTKGPSWAERKSHVGDIIRQSGNDPDILGVQECSIAAQKADMKAMLGDLYDYSENEKPTSSPGLIFWKKGAFSARLTVFEIPFCKSERYFYRKEEGLRIGDGSLTFCCTLIQYIQELTTKIVKIFYISKLTNIKALSTI